jgi:hypothetical protein
MRKKMMILCVLVLTFSCVANYAIATDSLEGVYFVKGWNPGTDTSGQAQYIGTATIKKTGQVYQVDWKIADKHHGGVGFYYEDTKRLAIAYAELEQRWFGEVVYTVEGKTLTGIWTVYDDQAGRIGKEVLTKE